MRSRSCLLSHRFSSLCFPIFLRFAYFAEERKLVYVLAVPKNQRIGLSHRADEVVASWPVERWQRLSAGEGRKAAALLRLGLAGAFLSLDRARVEAVVTGSTKFV